MKCKTSVLLKHTFAEVRARLGAIDIGKAVFTRQLAGAQCMPGPSHDVWVSRQRGYRAAYIETGFGPR
jgi:hypothetical protein